MAATHIESPKSLTPELLQQAAGPPPVYGLDLSKQGLISLCSFKQFPKLQTVNLSYNKLANLAPEGLFDGLKDLKELRITDNAISDVSEIGSGGLIALYADFNLIESVAGLGKLKRLELDGNRLETLETLPLLESMQDLSVNSNQIYMIGSTKEVLELLPGIVQFDLSENSLYSKLELLCLARSPTLLELDLRLNPCSAYPEFEAETSEEFPTLRFLNGKPLSRLTPFQTELKRLKETSEEEFGDIEDPKELNTTRPGTARGLFSSQGTRPQPRPQTALSRLKPSPTIEEMHKKNFIEDLNSSVLELKQQFKAAMSRIKATLQALFYMSEEHTTGIARVESVFQTQVKSASTLPIVDELDDDEKGDLDQSVQEEENKWFADELRKTQEEVQGPVSLQQKFAAYDQESSRQSSSSDLTKAVRKVTAKHKYLKLEKTSKTEVEEKPEEGLIEIRPNSKQRQKLQQAKDFRANQE